MTIAGARRDPRSTIPGNAGRRSMPRLIVCAVAALLYLGATYGIAWGSLELRGLLLVASIYAILALCLDVTAGMLGLQSLGVGGFFGIGAYLTTILSTVYDVNVFLLLPLVVLVTGVFGLVLGFASLRVSGLYFAITTFIFTLVMTVLATDLQITNGMQGLLGPNFPDLPASLAPIGDPTAWCTMLSLLAVIVAVACVRRSLLYPVLLAIRDVEPFAEAAGVRSAPVKIVVFAIASAVIGAAGWLFCFLGVVSPSQFNWAVSLNVLIMVLIGGINTTPGPIIGAVFVSMFPAVVRINPWLEEILYGILSIMAITIVPDGVVGLARQGWRRIVERSRPAESVVDTTIVGQSAESDAQRRLLDLLIAPAARSTGLQTAETEDSQPIVECRGVSFGYNVGPVVLRNVSVAVTRGHIHGLIGPNGSGKSTLANIIAGRLRPKSGSTTIKGRVVDGLGPAQRYDLGLRRTFQAAQLIQELTIQQNVLVGASRLVPGIARRAAIWSMLPKARRESDQMLARAADALRAVGAGNWIHRRVADVPHGIEQLTQLATVCVANPDIVILDEPATGLSLREVEHLAWILRELKARGVTIIIIEHQTRFLFPLCDLVTVLNAGEVVLTGKPDDVRAHPVVRKVYLGE